MAFFIPPLLYAGAGVAGGVTLAAVYDWLTGTKKGAIIEEHAYQEHYAPVITDARATSRVYAPTYQYQIDSPEASIVSKKDVSARSTSDPTVSPSRTQEGGAGSVEGVDMTKIAVIGVVGLVAYGLVSKK